MLQNIREHLQGWIAGVIIALIAVSFVLFGIQSYLQDDNPKQHSVATVNGKKITQEQLQLYYQTLLEQSANKNPNTDQNAGVDRNDLRKSALNHLISESVSLQAASSLGLVVSDDELRGFIFNTPSFQDHGQFSPQRFQQMLSVNGFTPVQFEAHLRQLLLLDELENAVRMGSFILPAEVEASYSLLNQKRSLGYFTVSLSPFIKNIQIKPQDIKAYYEAHQTDFESPESLSIAYVILDPKALAAAFKPTESALSKYYEEHKLNFIKSRRWQVADIFVPMKGSANSNEQQESQKKLQAYIDQIGSGTEFKSLAQAPQWLQQSELSPLQARALGSLKVGEVAKPYRDKDGYHWIKLLAIDPGRPQPFPKVKDQISSLLKQENLEQSFAQKSEVLANLSYTHPDSLSDVSQALKLPIQKSAFLTRNSKNSGILAEPQVLAVAFSDEVLQQDNNSNPIELKDGRLLVLRIDQHKPMSVLPLSQVQAKIQSVLTKQLGEQQALSQAKALQKALLAGKASLALAKQYGLSWQQKELSYAPGASSPLSAAAFEISPNKPSHPSAGLVQLADGNWVVFQVLSVQNSEYKALKAPETKALGAKLSALWGQQEYQLYNQGLIKQAHVKIKETELKQ